MGVWQNAIYFYTDTPRVFTKSSKSAQPIFKETPSLCDEVFKPKHGADISRLLRKCNFTHTHWAKIENHKSVLICPYMDI